jgi:hypothetical protein
MAVGVHGRADLRVAEDLHDDPRVDGLSRRFREWPAGTPGSRYTTRMFIPFALDRISCLFNACSCFAPWAPWLRRRCS